MGGFFGKLPGAGDFVARGVSPAMRNWLDAWLTRWVADYAREPDLWPPGGLRGLLDAPGGPFLVVIGPSIDRAGREFPLLACNEAPDTTREAADHWADRAAVALSRAVSGAYDADTLLAALETVLLPQADAAAVRLAAPFLWTDDAEGPPELVIPAVFGPLSSDLSSNPSS